MPKSRKRAVNATKPDTTTITRRSTLKWLRNGAIATPFVLGAGVLSLRSVQATICEGDLTKIGKGIPSVVQVHDPSCTLCAALQKQARHALRPYNAEQVRYLVANINTEDGSALAGRYGVPHVTLLFFDASGAHIDTLRGPTDADTVRAKMTEHLGAPT